MGIDASDFKNAMRYLTASVAVIATCHQGIRGGLTATAVVSVSVDPAQMLICVNRSASAHNLISESSAFCANFLTAEQIKIAERFAGMDGVKGDDRFIELGVWSTRTTGAPVLEDCRASFDCRTINAVASGTHTIYIGEVVDVALNPHAEALLYGDGSFVEFKRLKKSLQPDSLRLADTSLYSERHISRAVRSVPPSLPRIKLRR